MWCPLVILEELRRAFSLFILYCRLLRPSFTWNQYHKPRRDHIHDIYGWRITLYRFVYCESAILRRTNSERSSTFLMFKLSDIDNFLKAFRYLWNKTNQKVSKQRRNLLKWSLSRFLFAGVNYIHPQKIFWGFTFWLNKMTLFVQMSKRAIASVIPYLGEVHF